MDKIIPGSAAYLAWLRYALWGGEAPACDVGSRPSLLSLADRQKTRGLIFDALLRAGSAATGLSKADAVQMQEFLLQTFATHRMLDHALARAVSALQDAGVPAVLLKGQGAARSYPNPLLRECGDIDLYIGPERLEDAVRVLTPLADKVDDELLGKHWQLWMGGAEFELHQVSMIPTDRSRTRFYRDLEAEGFTRGLAPLDFEGVRVDTPEPTFNAFHLFYHAWHHFLTGGIGFRQLCDWTLHLHVRRENIDRERLGAMLDGMRLRRPWQLFGCIAVHDLGLPAEEFPCYDASWLKPSRRVLKMILSEGNFGRGHEPRIARPKAYVASKAYSLGLHCIRFVQTFSVAPREAWQVFASLFTGGFRKVFQDLFQPKKRQSTIG